jgi:DNA-binding protein YbaB
VGDGEFSAVGDGLRWIAEDLDESGRRLQRAVERAQDATYPATSPDGGIEVTADGRNRVTAVRFGDRLPRADQDHLDDLLTGTLNDALERARAGTREALLDALPVATRRDLEDAVDDVRRDGRR